MNKRALMLTAATVALLSGQAQAATTNCDTSSTGATTATLCDVTTIVVTPIATSTASNTGTANDVTFETTGGITVSTANATTIQSALKIDSDNNVVNFGTITNKNTTDAVGVEINAGNPTAATAGTTVATYEGSLGTIDLSGTGTGKWGLLIDFPTTAVGGILDATATSAADVAAGVAPGISTGTMTVVGDGSYGILLSSGVTLEGPLIIAGPMSVSASSTTSLSTTSDTGVEIDGNMVGDLSISGLLGGSVVAIGDGSRGLVVLGSVTGSIYNGGNIEALGTATTPTATTGNPQGGTAFVVANNITGGIENGGPSGPADTTTRAIIAAQGTGPAVLISPSAGGVLTPVPITIGEYDDTVDTGYSFYNRGQINATPTNVDTGAVSMNIVGSSATAPVTFTGGIFNSGAISASASTDAKATQAVSVTALRIGGYATVPVLVNSNEVGAGTGNITASVGGASAGQEAFALQIDQYGSLTSLINSGTISATAQTSDTTVASIGAFAINDASGTLSNITNTGTIEATTTILENNAQVSTAVNVQANTTGGVMFTNSGTVIGNVFFGVGNDNLDMVDGTGAVVTAQSGSTDPITVDFHGGHDNLYVGDTDIVNAAVLERGGGYVDVTVGNGLGTGELFVNNTDFASVTSTITNYDNGTLEVGQFEVKSGGLFGISLSQGFNQADNPLNPVLVSADNAPGGGTIRLDTGSFLNVTFGGFVSAPGTEPAKFVVLDAPSGNIFVGNPSAIEASVNGAIPFLFTGGVCAYNIAGFTPCTGSQTDSQLVVNLSPKPATGPGGLGLTGYAAQMFPLANAALANDNTLGAAVIEAGANLTSSPTDTAKGQQIYQSIYSQFAPEVTGASRALAITLTDQETGPVGARQRALRMYADMGGEMTLWGQQFVERLNNATNMANGYRDSGFGFVLGADGGSPYSGRFGAAFTFFSGDITEKLPAQVKTSSEWAMLSGYSDWRQKSFFFDGQVSVGYGSLDGKRNISIDGSSGTLILSRVASSSRASLLASGGFSAGTVLTFGSTVLTPQFSMDALTLRENGYTETGGGDGFDLKVDPYYAHSLRAYLGTSLRRDISFGDFYLQPEARIGYRYDFVADPVHLKAAFAADNTVIPNIDEGAPFTLIGPGPARGMMVSGAGIGVATGAWSLGLNYDYLSGGGGNEMAGTITLLGRI